MMKVSILYERPDDPEAFVEYYVNNHLPLTAKIPNV